VTENYLGQIILVGFNFAPYGWQLCNGSLLQINANDALFALIGTTFGGDGVQTFAVPDLRGRVVVGAGQGAGLQPYVLGEAAGTESVALTANQFAAHTHQLGAANNVTGNMPGSSSVLGTPASTAQLYAGSGTSTALSGSSIGPSPGQSLPHENRQPFTALNYIIALQGIFPSRN
jgi:microcystin-dependent protein